MVKIVVIADTHNLHNLLEMPTGDILIHCGDMTTSGSKDEFLQFETWFRDLTYKHKIIIAGNHDSCLERDPELAYRFGTYAYYLLELGITLEGIKFWGSPYSLEHMNMAFQYESQHAEQVWSKIPTDTDFLITHGPPFGVGDLQRGGKRVGCPELLKAVKRIKPHIHVFGHIHENYGWNYIDETACINCSNHWGLWDKRYRGKMPPIVIDWGYK